MEEIYLAVVLSKTGKEELKKVGAAKLARMCRDTARGECPCTRIARVVCVFPGIHCYNVSKRDWNEILNRG